MNILVADMGGTNCRFALLKSSAAADVRADSRSSDKLTDEPAGKSGGKPAPGFPELGGRCHLSTREYKDVYALLKALASLEGEDGKGFLPVSKTPSSVDLAVFAVAGPVRRGRAYAPNMGAAGNTGWHIDAVECAKASGIERVILINDFVAQAFACLVPHVSRPEQILGPASLFMALDSAIAGTASGPTSELASGPAGAGRASLPGNGPADGPEGADGPGNASAGRERKSEEPVAIVGAGTGLGMCLLLPQRSDNPYDRQYLASEGGHASFSFETPDEWAFAAFMREKTGKRRLIGDDVVSGPGLACLHSYFYNEDISPAEAAGRLNSDSKVLEYFAGFYGRVCRDYVLTTLALGGVCIAGGVAAKNPALVKHPAFAANFYNCGAHRALLDEVPVWLYLEADAGLWGAAAYAAGVSAATQSI